MDRELDACGKEHKELLKRLEGWKSLEREHQNRINDDAKELEKITNKHSLLLKKVLLCCCCVAIVLLLCCCCVVGLAVVLLFCCCCVVFVLLLCCCCVVVCGVGVC